MQRSGKASGVRRYQVRGGGKGGSAETWYKRCLVLYIEINVRINQVAYPDKTFRGGGGAESKK
jgi:hypothetical protein